MGWYLFFLNVLAFILCGMDKYFAKCKKNRVSEKIFYFLICFGGGFGFLFGMKKFHHKTRKKRFLVLSLIFSFLFLFVIIFTR